MKLRLRFRQKSALSDRETDNEFGIYNRISLRFL